MKRNVITIDENICNGCGLCAAGCYEGAIQLIDKKARVINEVFCDGLGACIGVCPVDAIKIEERDAAPYDECAVMEKLLLKGEKTIKAHLLHLKQHKEMTYLNQGLLYLKEHNISFDTSDIERGISPANAAKIISELNNWPIQLHLINPQNSVFQNADIILAADCTAYAFGNFHEELLKNHPLAIACPKLDIDKEKYIEKIIAMINLSKINSLTVIIMEVPCCGGLLQLAKEAAANSDRKIPIKQIMLGTQGELLKNEWL